MGAPLSLLQDVKGFARDYPRDKMPEGYTWDLGDYVPVLLDAQLTGRGGWRWASALAAGELDGGIYAPFAAGDRLLVCGANGRLYDVTLPTLGGPTGTSAITDVGATPLIAQNPVMLFDTVIIPDRTAAAAPTLVTSTGAGPPTISGSPASAPKARYATTYASRLVTANEATDSTMVRFSKEGDPAATWDDLSYIRSNLPVTGIAALRSVILIFHAGSVERIRGSIPPTVDGDGDMFLERLFDRAGCGDAKSIAYWQDNCIFADERGCHLTDGAVVRNLVSQGGLTTYWRTLYRRRTSLAACTFLDYYVITVIRDDGVAVTLICDLNRRTWFRFTNIKARGYIQSVGMQENIWGCRNGANRLTSIGDVFFPITGLTDVVDDDGAAVLPVFETPWYRMAAEGRKRVRFAYTSYDVRASSGTPKLLELGYITSPSEITYQVAGQLPASNRYSRHRLPIGKAPYGIAFRIRQTAPSTVTRVYDVAVEVQAMERSRM